MIGKTVVDKIRYGLQDALDYAKGEGAVEVFPPPLSKDPPGLRTPARARRDEAARKAGSLRRLKGDSVTSTSAEDSTTPQQMKYWRRTMGWSQVEAAKELGISASSIENYERGSRREDNRPVEIPKPVDRKSVV